MPTTTPTTQNPIFSTKDIADQVAHHEKALKEASDLWGKVKEKRSEEGKTDREKTIECARLTVTSLNRKKNYQMMIETNISVLNGASIEEAEKKYYENELDDATNEDPRVKEKLMKLLS